MAKIMSLAEKQFSEIQGNNQCILDSKERTEISQ